MTDAPLTAEQTLGLTSTATGLFGSLSKGLGYLIDIASLAEKLSFLLPTGAAAILPEVIIGLKEVQALLSKV